MWEANNQARRAGFGHRHSDGRRAAEASRLVSDVQARIGAIEADGRVVKERLEAVESEARALHQVAHPPEVLTQFEDYDQRLLGIFDRQLEAAYTYLAFAHGQPVDGVDLAHAISDLSDVARQASYYPLDANQIGRAEWIELLKPVNELQQARGIELDVDQHLEPPHPRPELGLERGQLKTKSQRPVSWCDVDGVRDRGNPCTGDFPSPPAP